jgi:hypothetical protein
MHMNKKWYFGSIVEAQKFVPRNKYLLHVGKCYGYNYLY